MAEFTKEEFDKEHRACGNCGLPHGISFEEYRGEVKRFGGGRPGSLGIALICSDCRDDHGLRCFEDVGRLNEYFLSLEEEG